MWVFARTFFESSDFGSLPAAAELKSSFSDYVRRMSGWFPFNKGSLAATDASAIMFELSLHYAKLAAVLAPKAPAITLARRKDGWRYRVRAIEAAWAGLKTGSGGKAASNDAAFRFAAEWIEECLVSAKEIRATRPPRIADAFVGTKPRRSCSSAERIVVCRAAARHLDPVPAARRVDRPGVPRRRPPPS